MRTYEAQLRLNARVLDIDQAAITVLLTLHIYNIHIQTLLIEHIHTTVETARVELCFIIGVYALW